MVSVQLQGALSQNGALETCYSPIIQSGDSCTLKFSAESNDKLLHFGSVVSSLGGRFLVQWAGMSCQQSLTIEKF